MARRIKYRVPDNRENFISTDEWEAIRSLQRWYNSEFFWTGGTLNFRRFLIFPNYDRVGSDSSIIRRRYDEMGKAGYSEEEIVNELEAKELIIVKRGGYEDGVIASGFTRVADNEFNAFLVLDFLIKVSRIACTATIDVYDEGDFVKPHRIRLAAGGGILKESDVPSDILDELRATRRIFAVVNPDKYDGHPEFSNSVSEFSELMPEERAKVLANWNWLGYESKASFDFNGDDFYGFDLNLKLSHLYFI